MIVHACPPHLCTNIQVDNFFVPPLTFLSEKLKLSPSVAGITLMALGNGTQNIISFQLARHIHDEWDTGSYTMIVVSLTITESCLLQLLLISLLFTRD